MAELRSNEVLARLTTRVAALAKQIDSLITEGGEPNKIDSISIKLPGEQEKTILPTNKHVHINLDSLSSNVWYAIGKIDNELDNNWMMDAEDLIIKDGLVVLYKTPSASKKDATLTINNGESILIYKHARKLTAAEYDKDTTLTLLYCKINKLVGYAWAVLDDDAHEEQIATISNSEIDNIIKGDQ